jgi:hypothetical protein
LKCDLVEIVLHRLARFNLPVVFLLYRPFSTHFQYPPVRRRTAARRCFD